MSSRLTTRKVKNGYIVELVDIRFLKTKGEVLKLVELNGMKTWKPKYKKDNIYAEEMVENIGVVEKMLTTTLQMILFVCNQRRKTNGKSN